MVDSCWKNKRPCDEAYIVGSQPVEICVPAAGENYSPFTVVSGKTVLVIG